MLYERWNEIAREFRNETALIDMGSGQRWTFRDLARRTDRKIGAAPEPVFAQGISCEFIFSVLQAWRSKRVVCPLEPGQTAVPPAHWPPGCVHLKTTSASTGTPRLIAFTAEQLLADVDQIVATMGLRRDWPNLGVISLAHSYGYSSLVLPLLACGIPLILASSPLPEVVRQAASLVPHLTVPAVPALWRAWLESRTVPENTRLAISAGAPLPLALEADVFKSFGIKIHNFYGASECGGIAYDATSTPRDEPTFVGSAMRNVELSLNNDGCLCVRTRAAGLTYWPEPDPSLAQGVYQTTDLAQLDGNRVFLRGRRTDQINVAGRKVSPESIERVLASHPGVRACLVFGAPSRDHDRTEVIVACVAAPSEVTAETLKQHLLGTLPAWQLPRAWWFTPALEANSRGKLSRAQWRQRYLAAQG